MNEPEAFWESGLILRTLSGSRAHGLAREGSDTDTRGVCIPPAPYLLGLSPFEQHESERKDHVTYALGKFVRLALQGNPNILESLFTDKADVLFVNDAGQQLLDSRQLFLSKQVGERFGGYANAQLGRLERHYRWLTDPPSAAPRPEDFGAVMNGGRARFPDHDRSKAFDAALKHWNHFQTWRRERNPDRARLEEAHGYDTKHAMHLVRLLRMGVEVLQHGTLLVRRPDAEELLAIRDGSLSYEQLMCLSHELTEQLGAARSGSGLPDEPDRGAAEELLVRLQLASLSPEG